MPYLAVKARVTGRVQGVAFRHWTRARATALGLSGWVQNEDNGSVSAVFDGTESAVEQMSQELWEGPGAASVIDVQTQPTAHDAALTGFQIRHCNPKT